MQCGSNVSLDTEATREDCPFCQRRDLANYILKETVHFRIVTDHAPLTEGHLLIIPRSHYTCYGDVPETLDTELFALKQAVQQFFWRYYAAPIFWEHGIYHQTVFHAHLHCFPFGDIRYDLSDKLHDELVASQDDLRSWYTERGEYFYLEDSQHAVLFPPVAERYYRVIRGVLSRGVIERAGSISWRSPQERYEQGKSLIQATKSKWSAFEQQWQCAQPER
jgi:diadenosine tetraphosphate (Ap4A) HIT family hydrolase